MPAGNQKVDFLSKASLPLQILLFCHGCYDVLYPSMANASAYCGCLFFLATVAIQIWKGVELPYPRARYGPEFVLIFAFIFIEIMRLSLGSRGNKTENIATLILFLVLSLFSVLANLFLIIWQTYVLRLDLILNLVGIVLIVLQFLCSVWAIVRFGSAR